MPDTKASELLACPQCGRGEVYLNPPSKKYRYGAINCTACLLTLPGEIKDQRELIEVWNNRASPTPAAGAAAVSRRARAVCSRTM